MAQPSTNDLKQRQSNSTVKNKTTVKVNGVPTTETTITKIVDDELIYQNGNWSQQETITEVTNNL